MTTDNPPDTGRPLLSGQAGFPGGLPKAATGWPSRLRCWTTRL